MVQLQTWRRLRLLTLHETVLQNYNRKQFKTKMAKPVNMLAAVHTV